MSSSYFSEPDYDNLAAYPPPAPTHSFDHHGYFVPDSLPAFDSTAANPPPPIYASAGGEIPLGSAYFSSETPILPPPAEMGRDGGYALREWRRQNAIRLEEKEKREKEVLNQIIREADAYKVQFQKKWELNCESNRVANREKEKVLIASLQKFHTEAGKDYWKSIAEVIPKEEAVVKGNLKKDEDRGKEKEKVKKPSVCIIQGPKPGKPTNLTMMRQLLLKMKHNSPPHLKLSSLPPETEASAPS